MEETEGLSKKAAAFAKDWTKGNILHNLLRLSWPMLVGNTIMILGPTIDMIWIGRLGAASMAAVTAGLSPIMLVGTAMMGLMTGMRAMVARFIGAGDVSGANHVAQQTLVISIAFSITMAVIGFFLSELILRLFGLGADVIAIGTAYMRIMFVGAAAMSFRLMAEGIMQASGDTVTPMRITIVYRFFHVLLAPFLIFGWWIFPRMGVSGAAVTNVASQSLAAVLGLWVLFSGRSRLRLSLRNFRLDFSIIWRIVRIGFPSLVSGTQQSLAYLILLRLMAPFGTIAVAAHGIVQRVEFMIFMPAMAFGMGSGVLVGQNLGAHQPGRAEKSAWLGAGLVEAFVVVCSVAILVWAEEIVGIFNPDPGLVATASTFLRIAVAGYMVVGFTAVLMQSLNGAGDTMPTMIFGVAITWLVTLPLAYYLPQVADLGVDGVRWGMTAGMLFGGLIYTIYFRMGRWKRKRV